MKIAVLSTRRGWHTDELQHAIVERGHHPFLLPYESLVARLGARASDAPQLGASAPDLFDCDAVIARIIPNGSLEQIIYRVDALHWLEDAGVLVVNPARAIERTVDKFYTSALLERAGLATPQTVVCERVEDAAAAFQMMGDVIVKPLFGSMGLGMVRVSDEETAWRVFRALEAIRGVYYLQRAVPHEGKDIRAFIIGDRVVAAIERRSPGWRTNISRGGEATEVELPAAWSEMALRAAQAVGATYAGVDLLPAQDGTVYVLEVNGIPGWRGLQEATSVNVAGALIDHVVSTHRAYGAARGAG
ncbi:MAG TPA: RimK family alpha-L-glutamate ligase [Gemmatimonadaceae bacterium]